MTVIGVVPAAGTGTRVQPIVGSKEVLRVGGRPLIDYLLERMIAGGATRIRVVVRPDKRDVTDHVARLGHEVVLLMSRSVSASVRAGLAGIPDDSVVLLGFPDSIWRPPDGFVPLRRRIEAGASIALGLFDSEEPERSDVVVMKGGRIRRIEIKPARPSSSLIWGCLAARASALTGLGPDEELSEFLNTVVVADGSRVAAVRLGRILDVGTRGALARANNHPLVLGEAP